MKNTKKNIIKTTVLSHLLLGFALFQIGCSASCKKVTADRLAFTQRTSQTVAPHMEVNVPFALADRLIAEQIKKIKVVNVAIPGLGPITEFVDKISIRPGRLVMKKARPDHVGFTLECDVLDGKKVLFSLTADAEVKPEIKPEQGLLEISLRPDMLRKVTPKITRKAKKNLGNFIYRQIPTMARVLISKRMAQEAAAEAISVLSSGFYGLLRDSILREIGEVSRIVIELPDMPIKEIKITSSSQAKGFMRLQIHSSLPVSVGLTRQAPKNMSLSQQAVQLRVSGPALAELGNWAFAQGHIPARYNTKGKPDKNGDIEPGLDWISGPDPMKAYLWKSQTPCMRLAVGATPTLTIQKNNLHIETNEVTIEDVEGSLAVKAGVWFYTLWADAIKVQQDLATQLKFKVSGTSVKVKIAKAEIINDELVVDLAVRTRKKR